MNGEFIPYEQALELKEIEFDEPCFGYFPNCNVIIQKVCKNTDFKTYTIAPLYQQAFRWFREKYGLHFPIMVQHGIWYFDRFSTKGFKTPEEAELACLIKLIEIVKDEK